MAVLPGSPFYIIQDGSTICQLSSLEDMSLRSKNLRVLPTTCCGGVYLEAKA